MKEYTLMGIGLPYKPLQQLFNKGKTEIEYIMEAGTEAACIFVVNRPLPLRINLTSMEK